MKETNVEKILSSNDFVIANKRHVPKHNFKTGDYIIKIIDKAIVNYLVDEVISENSFKARIASQDGSLSNKRELFQESDLINFVCNHIANMLANERGKS